MKCKLGLLINLKILGIWGIKLKAEYYWCCYNRISSHSWIRSGLVSLTDVLLPPFVNKKHSKIEKFAVLQFLYRRITNYHHHYHNYYHHHHYYYYYLLLLLLLLLLLSLLLFYLFYFLCAWNEIKPWDIVWVSHYSWRFCFVDSLSIVSPASLPNYPRLPKDDNLDFQFSTPYIVSGLWSHL